MVHSLTASHARTPGSSISVDSNDASATQSDTVSVCTLRRSAISPLLARGKQPQLIAAAAVVVVVVHHVEPFF